MTSSHSNSVFENEYKKLNNEQKEAVDTIDGPVMVIAGPGTGKTSILTLRIANILKKTDTAPENILALTFTESGAYAMRKKLVGIIGPTAYRVNINTFHSFCNDVIKNYPEKFPRIIGSTAINEIDQISIMEKIVENNEFELLKPFGDTFYYVKKALNEIKNLKREAVGIDEFLNIIDKQQKDFDATEGKINEKGAYKGKMKGEFIKLKEYIKKNRELLTIYRAYEETLTKEKLYDFEDMIMEVLKTLRKDKNLLLILQETYQYVLADEHQDANNAQNAVLELLSNFHKDPNLFIVGDEKQAIFRFQGASLQNFLYFQKIYPKAKVISLKENYRSTQKILDASHSLIGNNFLPKGHKRVPLIAKSQNLGSASDLIDIYEFGKEEAEISFIAKEIKKQIDAGEKPEEIAVLYRENREAGELTKALQRFNIAYKVESDNDLLKDENIRKLILILEAVNDTADDEKMARMLFLDLWGSSAFSLYEFIKHCRQNKKSIASELHLKFPEMAEKVERFASLAKNTSFIEFFEIVIKESKYIEYLLKKENSLKELETLENFFGELRNLSKSYKDYYLKDFIEHLKKINEHGIMTKSGKSTLKSGVRLMTAHRSKGLEFDFVYIVNVTDGHWSNKKERKYFHIPIFEKMEEEHNIDDERRLFYVAITRARKKVVVTYSKENKEGKEILPSEFIEEIDNAHKIIHKEEVSENSKDNLESKLAERFNLVKKDDKKEPLDKKYLQDLFISEGLSVTALNNYLECPWKYFFQNLIRLPGSQSKHQMYGTAVHETLQTFFNKYREEEDLSKKDLLALFEFNLKKQNLLKEEYKEVLKRGEISLGQYFDNYNGSWNRNLITELNIKGVHLKVGKANLTFDLLLKGKLDKVELISPEKVNVVDYKTGKLKSRNEIESKTKNADGNYKRQLIFYKLLLDLEEKKRFEMVSGELDFIEPDDNGKNRKERFEISNEDVEALKKALEEKSIEIFELSFWNKTCENKDCEFCELGKILKQN